jgi:hypothetical protein
MVDWNEVKCPHCKKAMRYNATICPHCQIAATEVELEHRKKELKSGAIGCAVLGVLACLALAYCSGSGDDKKARESGNSTPSVAISEPAPKPLPPQHLYVSIDGDDYLYPSAISDDERDAGKAASEFIAFRYRGVKDGKITLTSEGLTLRCDEDCTVISVIPTYGPKQHLQYTPSSVVGAAFTDAMNGLLVEHPSKKLK